MTLAELQDWLSAWKVDMPAKAMFGRAEFVVLGLPRGMSPDLEEEAEEAVLTFRAETSLGWIQWASPIRGLKWMTEAKAETFLSKAAHEVGGMLLAGSMERDGKHPWMPEKWKEYGPMVKHA